MKQEMTIKQKRLFEMTRLLDDSGCWIWQGQVSNSGYGRTKIIVSENELKTVSAHTASYESFISKVPEDCLVVQECGNRLCINPQHLALMKLKSAGT